MQHYQLAIIGGGMQGAALFWEATHRGIDAVLLERDDYGSGTSANSLRVVHGGLRHLQRADIGSCLAMIREQRILTTIAPSLVKPLLCAMPTTRTGMRSTPVMATGLWLYDRLRSLEALVARTPEALPASGMRGRDSLAGLDDDLQLPLDTSACWYDAQAQHAERLVLAFVNAARAHGATAHNHCEVTNLRRAGSGYDLRLTFSLAERDETIHCEQVADCSSDWQFSRQLRGATPRYYVKAVNLLLARPSPAVARALYVNNARVNNRLLFFTPWRNRLLVGTWYFPVYDRQQRAVLTAAELTACLDDLNSLLSTPVSATDVSHAHVGYLPIEGEPGRDSDPANQLVKDGSLFSMPDADGVHAVEATKFTMARALAVKAVDRIALRGALDVHDSTSATTPLPQQFDGRLFSPQSLARYEKLPTWSDQQLPTEVVADIETAIADEQALTLSDLLRRLPLGDIAAPPPTMAAQFATEMGRRLNWSIERSDRERRQLSDQYPLGKGHQ